MGPHPDPTQKGRLVFHWYEMCDAVQAETYEVDGIPVSNFVLPLYFTTDNEEGSRNDFLGTVRKGGGTLPSFGVNAGGYVGFFDPTKGEHDTYFADSTSRERARIKSQAGFARRGVRYKSQVDCPAPTRNSPAKILKPIPLVAKAPKKRGEADETVTELPRRVAGRK
jgi:hypothetical protein